MTSIDTFYVAATLPPYGIGTIPDQAWTEGAAISALDVSAYFSDVDDLVFSEDGLPAGLSLATDTGIITGTPTTPAGEVTVTITATNDFGAAELTFGAEVAEVAYDPTTALFGAGEEGFLFDLSSPSDGYMFEDSSKTTVCTATADPVAAIADRSGNGNDFLQSVNTNYRGEVDADGGVSFDGVDDYLSRTIDLSSTCDLTIIMAVKSAHTGTGAAVLLNQNSTGSGSFIFRVRENAGDFRFDAVVRSSGVGSEALTSSYAYDSAAAHLLTLVIDETAGTYVWRINGVQVASGSDTLTGSGFDNSAITMGCDASISNFTESTILNGVVRQAATSGTALDDAEDYFATIAGITL
jgi:hypothetical protein